MGVLPERRRSGARQRRARVARSHGRRRGPSSTVPLRRGRRTTSGTIGRARLGSRPCRSAGTTRSTRSSPATSPARWDTARPRAASSCRPSRRSACATGRPGPSASRRRSASARSSTGSRATRGSRMAYHAREHGFADGPAYVLVQGRARVVAAPTDAERLELRAHAERTSGRPPRAGSGTAGCASTTACGCLCGSRSSGPDVARPAVPGEPAVPGAPRPREPAPDRGAAAERHRPAGGRARVARADGPHRGTRCSAGRGRTASRSSRPVTVVAGRRRRACA